MNLDLTHEEEEVLNEIARRRGKADASELMRDVALRMIEEDRKFTAAVLEGMASADRGEFIEEEEMDAIFEKMLAS